MKPCSFDYVRCDSPDEALDVLAAAGDEARLMAGGQSLMAMLNMRLVRPSVIIDIAWVKGLRYARVAGGQVEVGAAMTQTGLLAWPELAACLPLVRKALPHVGHPATRNRGTICGSLCHADPSSELPLCLALLEGEMVLRSRRGRRVVTAAQFQTGMLSTDRRPDEMAVAARFPVAQRGWGYAFKELARRHGDFAIVALAAAAGGSKIRLGIGGVADRPIVREWDRLADSDIPDALNDFAWDLGGSDDIHATAGYRREMVRRLGRRVIDEARQCAA